MQSKKLVLGLYSTNCYIVSSCNENENYLMVIDPGDHFSYLNEVLKHDFNKKVTHIVLTHYHFDHIGALKELHEAYPEAIIIAGKKENTTTQRVLSVTRSAFGPMFSRTKFSDPNFSAVQPDLTLGDGDIINGFQVIETPGHTEGSICLYNSRDNCLFCGDTLFKDGCGRTDFEGGAPNELVKSLIKIFKLPPQTTIYPGHGEESILSKEKSLYF